MAGIGDGNRTKVVTAVVLVVATCLVLATLGVVPLLGLLALVVLGVAALVGRVVRRGHGWIAFVGLGLALVAIAIAVLALYAADDQWADLVLVIWVIVLGTAGCAWGVGIWVGRHWRSRGTPSEGAAADR
jgi:NADH:ubiquinone oxidoreductase subunit K